MTPKEKAEKLVNNYFYGFEISKTDAIECALIAVQEVINANPHSNPLNKDAAFVYPTMGYWQQVKSEIEKL